MELLELMQKQCNLLGGWQNEETERKSQLTEAVGMTYSQRQEIKHWFFYEVES